MPEITDDHGREVRERTASALHLHGPGPADDADAREVRTLELQLLVPPPAGLPGCETCAYWATGTPALCVTCANAGSEASAAGCTLCGTEVAADGTCPSTVCTLPDPWFSRISTVSERPEQMWAAIWRYKYDEEKEWAGLLARLLVGHLEAHRDDLGGYDAITTCALYVGPQANRLWDHLRLVLDEAAALAPEWPFAPDLIVKREPTGRFLGIGVEERRQIAEGELRDALSVPQPERVAGKRVLVLDDVFSEGFSMREMARVLRLAGADEVAGLVFARRKGG